MRVTTEDGDSQIVAEWPLSNTVGQSTVKVEEMTSIDFKQLHKFEMTREKYEATEMAMKTFQR